MQKIMTWGLAASVAVGLMAPLAAHGDRLHLDIGGIGISIQHRVEVRHSVPQDDTLLFQQWYAYQMRAYDRVDPDSGERWSNLVQMVTDVRDNSVQVTDQQYLHRSVLVTPRTEIVFPGGTAVAPPATTAPFHPGQLVVCEGYLRVGGGFVASRVRILGQARGWSNVDKEAEASHFDGTRIWGTVSKLDIFGNVLVLHTDGGPQQFPFDHDAVLIADGQEQPLDTLHAGDRVVAYYHNNEQGQPVVYRVVSLHEHDQYPDGSHPYWTDPAGQAHAPANGLLLEGHLRFIDSGNIFDTLTVRAGDHEMLVRCAKSLQVLDKDGHRRSIYDLQDGESLRVKYFDIGGTLFAERIEIQ
jgi:hypothetical protein